MEAGSPQPATASPSVGAAFPSFFNSDFSPNGGQTENNDVTRLVEQPDPVTPQSCALRQDDDRVAPVAVSAEDRPSAVPLAFALLQTRRGQVFDPTVFGVGRPLENGRFAPVSVNPKLKHYSSWNRGTNSYEVRRMTRRDVLRHTSGDCPLFQQNVAHLRQDVWDMDRLHAFVTEVFTDLDCDAGWDAATDAINGGRFRMTPASAKRLLFANPASAWAKRQVARLKATDPLAGLKQMLVECEKGQRRNAVRRALRQATRTRFIDVFDHELVVDIDAEKGHADGPAAAMAIAHAIVEDVLRPLGASFVEPSRNGGGAYVRFRVRRRTVDPRAFNQFVRALKQFLKSRYNREGAAAHVCKIGGELSWWAANDQYDENAFWSHARLELSGPCGSSFEWDAQDAMTDGEAYEWRRAHHGLPSRRSPRPVEFQYDPRYEPHVREHSDLITFALHDIDRFGIEAGADRVARYHDLLAAEPIDEAALRQIVPSDAVVLEAETAVRSKKHPKAVMIARCPEAPAESDTLDSSPFNLLHARMGRDNVILLDPRGRQHDRYMAASRIALRAAGGSATAAFAITLRLVESPGGPATGPRTPEREDHVRRAIAFTAATFDPGKGASTGAGAAALMADCTVEALEAVLRRKVSGKRLREANDGKGHATIPIVAVALRYYLSQILVDRNVSQAEVTKLLASRGLRRDTSTVAAVRRLLTDPRNRLLVAVRPACSREGDRRAAGFQLSPYCAVAHLLGAVADLGRYTFCPVQTSPSLDDAYGASDDSYDLQNQPCEGEAATDGIAFDAAATLANWSKAMGGREWRGPRLQLAMTACGSRTRVGEEEDTDKHANTGGRPWGPSAGRCDARLAFAGVFLTPFY